MYEIQESLLLFESSKGYAKNHFLPGVSSDMILTVLSKEGFRDMVLDIENLVCEYDTMGSLFHHIRVLGLTNCQFGMTSIQKSVYFQLKNLPNPRLSFEIIQFSCKK